MQALLQHSKTLVTPLSGKHLHEESRLKRVDTQRALLLEEFKEGIWTKEEYRKKVCKLTKTADASSSATQQNSRYSPEWETFARGVTPQACGYPACSIVRGI